MRIFARDPSFYLIELSDLREGSPPEIVRDHLPMLRHLAAWAEDYLCNPHPELGREGIVCPYTPMALKMGVFFFTLCPGRDFTPEQIGQRLIHYRDWFLEIEPREGHDAAFKTILMLFPDLPMEDVPRLIEGTQAALRLDYTSRGLMIGEFHPGPPNKAGLWNPSFRPLVSPVPLLAIRQMVPTDLPFLKDDGRLVKHYLDRFGSRTPASLLEMARTAARTFGLPFPEQERRPKPGPPAV